MPTPQETLNDADEMHVYNEDGLTHTRQFCPEDTSPYDTVTWDTYDANIPGKGGKGGFTQKDVKAPASWSQQTVNIVADKYFYGELGTDEREDSIRQLIERVVYAINLHAEEKKYFRTEDDLHAWNDDLRWLLLHQHGAFNSPVWFNVGLYQSYGATVSDEDDYMWRYDEEVGDVVKVDPRVHGQAAACFLVPVEDSIESIWEMQKVSARLFKQGSGIGTGWSNLRSTKDTLSGGGRPSGPVSFMEVQDATGKTIKSGGRTRRSAVMAELRCDHPDIEIFVEAKRKEEEKAHTLIDGGYDSSFNGEAYRSVKFQNMNLSVQVTDAFMKAAKANEEFDLKSPQTDEVLDTINARDLLMKMAEEAHACGDPGIQYDDTMQEWHTVPNSGRINTTNPCVTGDTLVSTEMGLRPIKGLVEENEETGVRVLGLDGELHEVSRIVETGKKPVYRLRTKAGFELKLTADHLVYTENRGDVEASELKEDDVLRLMPHSFGAGRIEKDKAELLGVALGDGCLMPKQFVLTMDKENEWELLENVADTVNSFERQKGGGSKKENRKECRVCESPTAARLATGAERVRAFLNDYIVIDEGCSQRRLTNAGLSLNKEATAALLRGVFSADGTVADYGEKTQYVALDSTSETLLSQVQQLLLGFGIKAKLYRDRRTKKVSTLPDGKGGKQEYDVKQLHSLRITRSSREVFEREIGFLPESDKGKKLHEMNERVSTYADKMTDRMVEFKELGEEVVYDLTEPETNHFVAGGIAVHNCAEFIHLDNTACNLASLNLKKFWNGETFDTDKFETASRIFFTAQEVLVGMASYPSEEIARQSYRFRPLGLGFANAGALVMSMGLPYDSEEARATLSGIMALEHFTAYDQSARLARAVGAFEGYEENENEMLDVLMQHENAAMHAGEEKFEGVLDLCFGENDVYSRFEISEIWDRAKDVAGNAHINGSHYGFRNSQATVLAPTGTISFFMGCDTTGVEPAYQHVTYKRLAGEDDSMIMVVNDSVEDALLALDYKYGEVDEIVEHIKNGGSFENAPHIEDEHLPVFDCADKPQGGERSIDPMGHVKMIAALQPFVSGGISKTINLPEDATVQDIYDVYMRGWELETKALSVYRNGSKRSQAVSTSSGEEDGEKDHMDYVRGLEKTIRGLAERLDVPEEMLGLRYTKEGDTPEPTGGYEHDDFDAEMVEEECSNCGNTQLIPTGTCSVCPECGETTGCA